MLLDIFKENNVKFRLDDKYIWIFNLISTILFLFAATILASRDLSIAKDDLNYYNYFYYAKNLEVNSLLVYLIDEPLWRLYTVIITSIFNTEYAFRATLFISSSLFLFSIRRVNRRLSLIVLLVFLFSASLATQMYFNQIRQGLALSVFLAITVYGKRPILGAILATFIHTSFVFPLIIIFIALKAKSIRYIVFYSTIVVIVLYFGVNVVSNFDLGRRSESYEFEGSFTLNYYISAFLRYVPLFFIINYYNKKKDFSFWFKVTLSAFIILIPFTLFHGAAGRIVYYLTTFVLLMLLDNYKSLGGKLALCYYIIFFIFETLVIDTEMFERWVLILQT